MKTKFNKGDAVAVNIAGKLIEGIVAVVDSYGIFADSSQPFYDIYCKEDDTLYKHFPESSVMKSGIHKNNRKNNESSSSK